jgi:5'-methylthioadenosine phosphorylase
LRSIGVERVISTNAVGAIKAEMKPGDLVVPNDFLDFTRGRFSTFYEGSPVTHIDVTEPYCSTLRNLLLGSANAGSGKVWDEAVLVCVEGPRLETPAEIRMFRALGGDIIGMTGLPEAALARELEMCYAAICYVSNMAAGMQKEISAEDVAKTSAVAQPKILRVLERVIPEIPEERVCPCSRSLEGARL